MPGEYTRLYFKTPYMENTTHQMKPLVEKSEEYLKTNIELLKLKSIDKFSEVASNFISRLILIIVISIFLVSINVTLALWLGELAGKTYLGFLLVASFYAALACFVLLLHLKIRLKIYTVMINQFLN